jgi:hypothetical protein
MEWIKKGLVFKPQGDQEWMLSHAALPLAQRLDENLFRVYFCSRDSKGRAQIGHFDFDPESPTDILYTAHTPTIRVGSLGAFDDSGVTTSCIARQNNTHYQYYTGWSLGVTVPFYYSIGLAVSRDGCRTFRKISDSPIMDRNDIDPYLNASPFVLIENDIWRMWYVSGVKWEFENGRPKHYYHIKSAESKDGINWERAGIICVDFKSEDEYAIARPCVLREDGLYKMWYSYRGKSYRIGYAESKDGLHWERKDEQAGIDVSELGWDSEMIEYPFVFDHKGKRYMLYNGNDYGKTGIGLAILVSD